MGALENLIKRKLDEEYHQKMVLLGYFCPRCQIIAPPRLGQMGAPGWCPFCGMDPREEGPARPPQLVGIRRFI